MAETERQRALAQARQRQALARANTQVDPVARAVATMTPSMAETVPSQQSDPAFERTRKLGGPGFSAASEYAGSIFGPGITNVPAEIPLGYNDINVQIPRGPRVVAGKAADIAMVPLSALSGVAAGAAGLVGDAADALGMRDSRADALSRDLAAIPEAFAGTPTVFGGMARSGAAKPAPEYRPAPQAAPNVGQMVRDAAGGSGTNRSAQRLADNFDLNAADRAAAERLGMDLPADVFSDNPQVREAAGLTRSLAGTEVSAEFREAVAQASERATEAMRVLGGDGDISLTSANVRSRLQSTIADLEAQSSTLYGVVNDAIPANTRIEPANMVRAVNALIDEMGGVNSFTTQEQRLFNMVTGDDPITYQRLLREKRLIGRAIERGQGPYADADEAALRRIYGAMVEDQLSNVERVAGGEVRANLEAANKLHGERMDLQKEIVSAFGRDQEGSIASNLRLAITRGASGDISALNRTLSVVPQELRREAVVNAIAANSMSRQAAAPGFSFANYAKTYDGLSRNSQVMARINTTVGPEAANVLRDLAAVSRRVTEARANVLTTGKANQALVQDMTAENLVGRILQTSGGRGVVRTTATGAGAATGGAIGAVGGASVGEGLISALSKGSRERILAAGRLFNSPQFQKLVDEAAIGAPSQATIEAVAKSGPFIAWANRAGIDTPAPWLASAVLASNEQEGSNQDQQPQ